MQQEVMADSLCNCFLQHKKIVLLNSGQSPFVSINLSTQGTSRRPETPRKNNLFKPVSSATNFVAIGSVGVPNDFQDGNTSSDYRICFSEVFKHLNDGVEMLYMHNTGRVTPHETSHATTATE